MTRKMDEHRKAAAEMNRHMRQLAAEGIRGPAALPRMMGYLPALQQIWTTTTDVELSQLLREHPLFHEFARLMEDGAAAERKKASAAYRDLPELPDPLKQQLADILTRGATLETGLRSALDEPDHPAFDSRIDGLRLFLAPWWEDCLRLKDALGAPTIPRASQTIVWPMLHDMAQRIATLLTHARPNLDPR